MSGIIVMAITFLSTFGMIGQLLAGYVIDIRNLRRKQGEARSSHSAS